MQCRPVIVPGALQDRNANPLEHRGDRSDEAPEARGRMKTVRHIPAGPPCYALAAWFRREHSGTTGFVGPRESAGARRRRASGREPPAYSRCTANLGGRPRDAGSSCARPRGRLPPSEAVRQSWNGAPWPAAGRPRQERTQAPGPTPRHEPRAAMEDARQVGISGRGDAIKITYLNPTVAKWSRKVLARPVPDAPWGRLLEQARPSGSSAAGT